MKENTTKDSIFDENREDLEREAQEMVDRVENYTDDDHDRKKDDLEAAFAEQDEEKKNRSCGCGN